MQSFLSVVGLDLLNQHKRILMKLMSVLIPISLLSDFFLRVVCAKIFKN